MRTIRAIHKAAYEPIADLVTYRAMPTASVAMNQIDPFLFLNHHGWQEYAPLNQGLPFGPHPHRGFETVTFILEGDLTHKDSSGAESVIKAGGIQWMTAGSGLIHAEISSEEFKKNGGPLEILQLWINLPARYKMTAPRYIGLQENEIPTLHLDNGKITAQLVSGIWNEMKGAIDPLTDIHLSCIKFKEGGQAAFTIPQEKNIFLYIVKGQLEVNDINAGMHHLVEFDFEGEAINLKAINDSVVLFGYATPFREPIVAYGPFVMNTPAEIQQAYQDYRQGKFGREEELMK